MKKSTISKFFDSIRDEITCCLVSKRIVSDSNSIQFEERNTNDLLTRFWVYCWRKSLVLPLVIAAIMMTGNTGIAQNILGQAPVVVPAGGFAVDGDAFAGFPLGSPYGDFLFKMGETNDAAVPGGVFVPVPPAYTYPDGPLPSTFYITPDLTTFFRDNITNNDPTIFTSSNKIDDDPSTYTWGVGSSPNKNEIQNAIAHFSYGDPNLDGGKADELWMIFAADRQVTNGSSYIDFEILQKSLTINTLGTDNKGFEYGNFISAGTENGRTTGDLLVTIEFTQGGAFANVVARKWDGDSYELFPIDINDKTIFGTNNTVSTLVPYPVYNQDPIASGPNAGMWEYAPNQWAEGAVNLTALFGNDDPCFVISTLFVRTRTSGSSGQSELKDFPGIPIQLNLCSDTEPPVISSLPEPSFIECLGTPSFATPTATDNCELVSLVFADVTTTGNCGLDSVTRTWTATDKCGNTSTAAQIITIVDTTAPVLSGQGADADVECTDTPVFTAPTAADDCDNAPVITYADVTTTDNCGLDSVTRTWTATDCSGNVGATVSQTLTIVDTTAPVITCPADVTYECDAVGDFGKATATDNCDANPKVTFSDVRTEDCGNTYHIDRTWTAEDCAGNKSTCVQKIKVVDTTAPVITCAADKTIECNAAIVFDAPTATDNCDASPLIVIVSTSSDGLTRTWKAVDACGNESTTCSQTITVESCEHIFPTQTTCCNYITGTATGLYNVCTTVSGKTVTNAIPGVFFYYSSVTAPAANFTIEVKQSNDGDLNKLFTVQNANQVRLSTSDCGSVTFTGTINSAGNAAYNVTGATPGATYIVSVKYDTKAIIGGVYSGADLVSKYTFASYINGSGTAATGSTGTIDAVAGCSDNTPLPGDCTIPSSTVSPTTKVIAPTDAKTELAGFTASPVPFKDQLTIKYDFDYQSDVKIEVFNAQGNKVLSKADTNSYLNKEVRLNLDVNRGQEQVYVVKLTTNRGSSTKKVMSSR